MDFAGFFNSTLVFSQVIIATGILLVFISMIRKNKK